nr:hypothetical protein [Planctomycetota bacterium]
MHCLYGWIGIMAAVAACGGSAAGANERPNIVLFLSDDMVTAGAATVRRLRFSFYFLTIRGVAATDQRHRIQRNQRLFCGINYSWLHGNVSLLLRGAWTLPSRLAGGTPEIGRPFL